MPVSKNKKPKKKAIKKVVKKTTKKSTTKKPTKKKKVVKKAVKKIVKKKTGKKTTPKKVEKKIEAEIKEAVDKLPGLIVEQVKFSEPEEETYTKKEFSHPTYYNKNEKKKRQLLWLTVTAFTAVILVMWGWNTITMFTDTKNIQKNNQGILDQARADWENVQNTMDEKLEEEKIIEPVAKEEPTEVDIKDSLKASLTELLNAVNATSTATTTNTTS